MATTHKLGKARITFDGIQKPAESQKTGVYKARFRIGHCLLRKQRYAPRPNAVFRRWALDGASLQVLIHNLDHQEMQREREMIAGLRRVSLARAANEAARAADGLGDALRKAKRV